MQTPISRSTLNFGLTVESLLVLLEENFKHYQATPHDAYETIMYRSGQRSVVEYIKQVIEDEG
jgi:hypothetical protein